MSRYRNYDSNNTETAVCPHPTQKVFDWQALNELMYHKQKTSSRSNDEVEDNL